MIAVAKVTRSGLAGSTGAVIMATSHRASGRPPARTPPVTASRSTAGRSRRGTRPKRWTVRLTRPSTARACEGRVSAPTTASWAHRECATGPPVPGKVALPKVADPNYATGAQMTAVSRGIASSPGGPWVRD